MAGADGARARWRIPEEIPGTYELSGRWPRQVPRLTAKAWAVVGSERRCFSQRTGGGRWQPLLRFRVPEPRTVAVEIGREGPGVLAADVLRLVQVPDDPRVQILEWGAPVPGPPRRSGVGHQQIGAEGR